MLEIQGEHACHALLGCIPTRLIVVSFPYRFRARLSGATLVDGRDVQLKFAAPFVADCRGDERHVRSDGENLGMVCGNLCGGLQPEWHQRNVGNKYRLQSILTIVYLAFHALRLHLDRGARIYSTPHDPS